MVRPRGLDVLQKNAKEMKFQATLQSFFRPKAAPIFDSPVAPAPAALEPVEVDPMLADARVLLSLAGGNDDVVVLIDSDEEQHIDVGDDEDEESSPDALASSACELFPELGNDITSYLKNENATRRHVWTPTEKSMVLKVWAERGKSVKGTINYFNTTKLFINYFNTTKLRTSALSGERCSCGITAGPTRQKLSLTC